MTTWPPTGSVTRADGLMMSAGTTRRPPAGRAEDHAAATSRRAARPAAPWSETDLGRADGVPAEMLRPTRAASRIGTSRSGSPAATTTRFGSTCVAAPSIMATPVFAPRYVDPPAEVVQGDADSDRHVADVAKPFHRLSTRFGKPGASSVIRTRLLGRHSSNSSIPTKSAIAFSPVARTPLNAELLEMPSEERPRGELGRLIRTRRRMPTSAGRDAEALVHS